ncbi:MAG: hypothetical protein JW878_10705, partial [Methanomicrobia archaeon]|nr:hypothetical protein [Methanomicrobia archaeon]
MAKVDNIRVVSSILHYLTWACGPKKGREFWSQYVKSISNSPEEQKEKIRAKLDGAYIIHIELLLSNLKEIDQNESYWSATEVLEEDVLAQQANSESASFSTIANLFQFLPSKRIPSILSKLDSNILADKFDSPTAQPIMWFLRYCSANTSSQAFSESFLSNLHEKGKLIEALKNSNVGVVNKCLKFIGDVNLALRDELKNSLLPYWVQISLSSNLSSVTGEICNKTLPIEIRR